MTSPLPPAVLDLIVNAAEWVAGITAATQPLLDLQVEVTAATDAAARFGADLGIAGAEAVTAMDEVALAASDAALAMDAVAVSADDLTFAQDAATAASDSAALAADALAGSLDRAAASADLLAAAQDRDVTATERSTAAKFGAFNIMGLLTNKYALMGESVAGLAAISVDLATKFQSATVRLVTSAGEIQTNLKLVQNGILQLAGQVGVSSLDLANAMYFVESAGFHAADGLNVLKAAAQGAKAEGANTTDVVKALTDVLKDYHLPASDAATVTSQMIAAVAHGKTTLQDFSKAFANIIPAASAAGISFTDAASALAEMTNHGFTAQRASMNLAQALRSLLNPTKPMLKAFAEFGVSTDTLKAKLAGPNGLTESMQYLATAALKAGKEGTPAFAAALKLLIGTAPGANAALTTVGANFADTTATIKSMTEATTDAQGNVKGFALVQQNFGQTLERVKASVGALAIKIGNALLPILTKMGGVVANVLSSITSNVGSFAGSAKNLLGSVDLKPIIDTFKALGNVIGDKIIPIVKDAVRTFGPVLGVALGAAVLAVRGLIAIFDQVMKPVKALFGYMDAHKEAFQAIAVGVLAIVAAMKAWAIVTGILTGVTKALAVAQGVLDLLEAANPITLIILAVIGLVAAFVYLWQTSSSFRKFWEGLWNAIKGAAEAVGKWFAGPFVNFFKDIGRSIGGFVSDVIKWFKDLPDKIAGFFKDLPYKIGYFLGFLGGTIAKKAKDAGKAFLDAIVNAFKAVVDFFKNLPDKILKAMSDPQQWLNTPGMKVIRGLGSGIVTGFKDVVKWFHDLPDNLVKTFGNANNWLNTPGMTVIRGLASGIVTGFKDVVQWFKNLPGNIGGFFKDVGKWLWDAGKNLIMGLVHGFESAMGTVGNAIKSFAGGIVDGFKSAMGIGSPSKVMADEVGQHITGGIAQGMLNGMTHVHGAVSQIRDALTGAAYGTLNVGSGGGGFGGLSTGGAGGGTLIIQNNIAGTVVGETQLSEVMRTQVLRYNQRNPTNGLSLFGRGTT